METYKFIPSVVRKGEFEGDATITFMEFEKRWGAYGTFEELRQAMTDDPKAMKHKIALMLFLAETVKPYVTAVCLTRKSDGRMYQSLDQLTRDPRCDMIFQEIALFVISGTEADEEAGKL